MMTLDEANDALTDAVMRFRNMMLREGEKELPPHRWAAEFRSWLDPYLFEEEWKSTQEWLKAVK